MWEPHEPRPIIEAAEQAAAAGNYASAERLLREAVRLQEASLGPLHPDLANTLNNLGVVCEITDKPVDAEQYFRRAFAIATAVLDPDHPFVTTSGKNLRDFCEARGKQIELTTQVHAEPQDLQPVSRIRRLAIGALGPLALLIVILVVGGLPPIGSSDPSEPSSIALDSQRDIAPQPSPASLERVAAPTKTASTAGRGPNEANASQTTAASTVARPIVVRARLCAELENWSCDPPDRPIPPGPLYFYTQLKFSSTTTIQHRWYWNNRLNQSLELRVEASPTVGYRTYSRNTMKSESTGDWRVELRSEDGALLHEERFTVR